MKNKIVEVIGLSHKYSVDWAIKNISFEISDKGVFGLLGSNGAGKSTTMNIICGVLNQTSGDVFINGISLKENPREAKKYIGFLPQNPPLHLDLTVDEYLYHCADLRMINKKEIPTAMDYVKKKCGISHFSHRLLKNLSGGYRQRVGIAQSIIHNPMFVILDEPTNGLDPNQILAVRALIQDIAKDRAVLISTHILSEVQATCDYIKMIERGDVVFSGTKEEFSNYMEPDTLTAIMGNSPTEKELLEIEEVTYVEFITSTKLRIHFNGDSSILKHIIGKSITNDWKLREIRIEKESLDTIFAKLSGKLNVKNK